MGGLGNQLFQYATGKTLAIQHNTTLKLDLSFLNKDSDLHTKRNFELDVFKIDYELCSIGEVDFFTNRPVLQKYLPFLFSAKHVANEKSFEFDAAVFSFPKNTYLNGFWQSERYFAGSRRILLDELVVNRPESEKVRAMKNLILNSNSVSLHVRRGDYISNPISSQFHGNLQLDYYHKAIDYLNNIYNDLKFFVFSDDIAWVKLNLKPANDCEYIDFNTGKDSAFDLQLMSLCKHNIIANSSFSWWGAWLNQNRHKIVISPEHWFADKSINTKDLIPKDWIKL